MLGVFFFWVIGNIIFSRFVCWRKAPYWIRMAPLYDQSAFYWLEVLGPRFGDFETQLRLFLELPYVKACEVVVALLVVGRACVCLLI
jgi:hypothetical protein